MAAKALILLVRAKLWTVLQNGLDHDSSNRLLSSLPYSDGQPSVAFSLAGETLNLTITDDGVPLDLAQCQEYIFSASRILEAAPLGAEDRRTVFPNNTTLGGTQRKEKIPRDLVESSETSLGPKICANLEGSDTRLLSHGVDCAPGTLRDSCCYFSHVLNK